MSCILHRLTRGVVLPGSEAAESHPEEERQRAAIVGQHRVSPVAEVQSRDRRGTWPADHVHRPDADSDGGGGPSHHAGRPQRRRPRPPHGSLGLSGRHVCLSPGPLRLHRRQARAEASNDRCRDLAVVDLPGDAGALLAAPDGVDALGRLRSLARCASVDARAERRLAGGSDTDRLRPVPAAHALSGGRPRHAAAHPGSKDPASGREHRVSQLADRGSASGC